jgi:hypothetical protein
MNILQLASQLARERERIHSMTGIAPNVMIVSPAVSIDLANRTDFDGHFAGMLVIESLNASDAPILAYVDTSCIQRLARINA